MFNKRSRLKRSWQLLPLTLLLALGLLAPMSWQIMAQPPMPEDCPLHPLSEQGLIPPVYLSCLDEAVANREALNSNSGVWNGYQAYLSGSSPEVVVGGDFTGDGKADVALATDAGIVSQYDKMLHWFQWASTNELVRFERQDGAQKPRGMASGDLDGNGYADIVVADHDNNVIGIFYQSAPGTFAAMQSQATGSEPNAVAVGDLNNDSRPDVAVAHASSPFINLYLQQADGTLASPVSYTASGGAINDLAIGDLDGDNDNDLALVRAMGSLTNEIALYYQDGGVLQNAVYRDADDFGFGPHAGAIGDVTGDGRADLVVTVGGNTPKSKLNLFIQQSDGSLPSTPQVVDAYDYPSAIAIADVNHDGRNDVAALHDGYPVLTLYLQQADGSLGSYESYPLSPSTATYSPDSLVLADVTADGALDVVIANKQLGLLLLTNRNPVGSKIERTFFSNGGSLTTSNSFRLGHSVAQPALGSNLELSNSNYHMQTGFFSAWLTPPNLPNTTITSRPSNPTNSSAATFEFTADQDNSTFECQLDGAGFSPCSSPQSYTGLAQGSHTFEVRATNSAGQTDSSPASYTWSIESCYTLAVAADPTVGGTVTRDPQPNCNGTYYSSGTVVRLTPNANPGYFFTNWSGNLTGSTNPSTVTMDSHKAVVAHFDNEPVEISEIEVTNVRDIAFNVSWITKPAIPITGTVYYGTDPTNLDQVAYDDRDKPSAPSFDDTHYVTIQGLSPETTYYFKVVSGNTTDDNNGEHHSVKTGPSLGLPGSDTVFAQVFKSDESTFAEGTIVYITLEDANNSGSAGQSAPLAALVDNNGYWFTNLADARTTNLNSYFTYSNGDKVQLKAQGAADSEACETVIYDNSIPNLVLNDSCTILKSINLLPSWNHISLPLEPTRSYTAESACDEIANQGGNAVEIDRWYAGGWNGHICGYPFNDFPLELGSDYFIKSNSSSIWTIEGHQVTEPVTLTLHIGWNSIGLPHTDGYSAETLCDVMIQQGISVVEIDRWHNGGWQGHPCGLPFNQFPIERGVGYFVKTTSAGTVAPPTVPSRLSQPEQTSAQMLEMVPKAQVAIRDLQLSNLQDTAVTISWMTDEPASGYVIFGETTELGRVAYDSREATTIDNTHYVILNDLAPETTYYFVIISGATVDDNHGSYYTITTTAEYKQPPASDTVYGQLFHSDGTTPAENAIVTLTLIDNDDAGSRAQANLISALTDQNGYWDANLGNARQPDSQQPFAYSARGDRVELTARTATEWAKQTVDTSQLRPAAPLNLRQSYKLHLPLTSNR